MPEHWLNVDEIASHLGVSSITIYRWVESKKIPSHRLGRQWRIKATEVDEWLFRGDAKNLHKHSKPIEGELDA